ncbi:2-dehydro-3-deoxygalactonokinase [Sandaracinobacteroides hominis]|uniref:2-dehydro-3-deoxygalactonokinase n=1 Tax=Sandaracinobacteroides hominis TaxID=2780086 RepID=UPI002E28FC22|nr:2-dehydro-3-deoxygalactonokinase [Sandaracinobacteroides hominis]
MVSGGAFLAIDWGTSNRRVWRLEGGDITATERDGKGAGQLKPQDYPAELAAIRARLGDLPVRIAGMAGSTVGWREAPYAPLPAGLADLRARLLHVDTRTAIVPGVAAAADIMRGEEVQVLGAVAAGLVPPDALVVQPGTHSKWARLEGGRIADFTTAMTGELYALLRQHSLLARQLAGQDATPGTAFLSGVAEGARRDLAASLFSIRARSVLGLAPDSDAASYASGLLIGAEVAAQMPSGAHVHLLANPPLSTLYATAIEVLGGSTTQVDSETAFLAGIRELQP